MSGCFAGNFSSACIQALALRRTSPRGYLRSASATCLWSQELEDAKSALSAEQSRALKLEAELAEARQRLEVLYGRSVLCACRVLLSVRPWLFSVLRMRNVASGVSSVDI